MAEIQPIDILRPPGDFGAFEVQAILSKQRYRLQFAPTEPARGGSWWMTIVSVVGVVLVRSVRLVASPDLIAFARDLVDGLPPGRLALVCPTDPTIDSLTVEGLVVLTYEVD